MILINNCPHDNKVYTIIDKKNELIIKSSCSKIGIQRISNEFSGYRWFLERTDKNKLSKIKIKKNKNYYARFYGHLFPGTTGNLNASITDNYSNLLLVINFYQKIWPRNQKFLPLHGDFSIGNIIFHKNKINIIDWEHFSINKFPWGFDLLNILFESINFSMQGKKTLYKLDEISFINLYTIIFNLINKYNNINTYRSFSKFIKLNKKNIWGDTFKKLPAIHFNYEQIDYIGDIEKYAINSLARK
jgi:hypothetical protein